jgi:hypothetical protein
VKSEQAKAGVDDPPSSFLPICQKRRRLAGSGECSFSRQVSM